MADRSGNRFEGRAAIVTGGASGIGRAAVLRFLEEGASVTFADLNDANADETLALARAAGHGGRIAYFRADVTDEAAVRDCFEGAAARWGRLDIAFLNAGVGGAIGPITETTADEWDVSFAFLVRSVFLGAKHAVPAMRANPGGPDGRPAGGAIVATGSVAGLSGGGGPHAYSAAKAAVINLVRSLALELASYRIRGERGRARPDRYAARPWRRSFTPAGCERAPALAGPRPAGGHRGCRCLPRVR